GGGLLIDTVTDSILPHKTSRRLLFRSPLTQTRTEAFVPRLVLAHESSSATPNASLPPGAASPADRASGHQGLARRSYSDSQLPKSASRSLRNPAPVGANRVFRPAQNPVDSPHRRPRRRPAQRPFPRLYYVIG